jgi:Haem-binding domain
MKTKIVKVLLIIVALAVLVIQVFQIDKSAPPIVPGETLEAAVAVPADVGEILGRSCGDCHTNQTQYPWYASVQPFGWLLKDHIDDGRAHLNFSIFNTYADKKKSKKLEEICDEVQSAEMPLPSYLWIHRISVLSDSDRKALCEWTKQTQTVIDARTTAAGQ